MWGRLVGQCFERRFPTALRDVDRQHLHAMTLRVLHELRRRVEPHRLAVQQRGEEDRGFVAFEPAARVREFREAGGVAFRETVFAEALDLLEDLFGEFARVVAFEHPADDLVLIFLEIALALPRGHRAAQVIRFAGCKTGRNDRDLHHLLLEDRHTQRANEHFLERVARIRDLPLLFAGHDPAPLQIRMHRAALNRTGPHDRHLDDEIVVVLRPQPRQHRHLRARFDLEHADGIGTADHVVGCLVILRNVFQREWLAVLRWPAPRSAQVERAMQCRQHAEREHVDLHQPERFEIVLVPLDHAPPVHRRVLDRHEPRELAAADHEAARMLRQVARKVEQAPRQFGPCLNDRRRRIEPGRRELLQQVAAAVEPAMALRDAVDQHRIDAERLAGFTQHAARAIRRDGGGKRRAIMSVFRVDMLDHFLTTLMLEVDVDIRRLAAFLADETLEQHRALIGIHFGDAEAVTDHRVRGRTPPLAQDVLTARVFDDVVDGQEKRLVFQFRDQGKFIPDLLCHLLRHTIPIASSNTCPRLLLQVTGRRVSARHEFEWIFILQIVEIEIARIEHRAGFANLFGRKQLRDPPARTQMLLRIRRERIAALGHRHPDTDRRHHVLQRLARTPVHRHVAERDESHAAPFAGRTNLVALHAVERALQLHEPEPRTLAERRAKPRDLRIEHVRPHRIRRHENREAVGHPAQVCKLRWRRRQHPRRQLVRPLRSLHPPP
ncbi:titin [Burkholderia cenocepacia KC-01]|nr:titin [Burkholderia cenocepacia KC-01]